MAKFIQGKVVEQHRWTGRLLSLKVEAAPIGFEAEQFTGLALLLPAQRGMKKHRRRRPGQITVENDW